MQHGSGYSMREMAARAAKLWSLLGILAVFLHSSKSLRRPAKPICLSPSHPDCKRGPHSSGLARGRVEPA